jgi:hypothetical protein
MNTNNNKRDKFIQYDENDDGCGYVYFRKYEVFEICKLGITNSLYHADMDCINEFINSDYVVVFEVPIQKMAEIEQEIIYKFDDLRVIKEHGKYFYNKEILDLVEPFLIERGYTYKKLTVVLDA